MVGMPSQSPSGGGGAAWRHLLLLLTALPLALQWRGGGVDDPASPGRQARRRRQAQGRRRPTPPPPWLFYHKVVGVGHFLLFVEGKAAKPGVAGVLESIPGVKVVYRTKEVEEQQARSRIQNKTWLAGFVYKPCNYELFVKQSLNMEMAIVMARPIYTTRDPCPTAAKRTTFQRMAAALY